MNQQNIPAGYYPDPENPGATRWWDGNAWGPAGSGNAAQAPKASSFATGGILNALAPKNNIALLLSYGLAVLYFLISGITYLIGLIGSRDSSTFSGLSGMGISVFWIILTLLVASFIGAKYDIAAQKENDDK